MTGPTPRCRCAIHYGAMNRHDANREVIRLIDDHRALPFDELLALADQPSVETQSATPDGLVTFLTSIKHHSASAVRVTVSAFGNNWFRFERLDESAVIRRPTASDD